MNTHFITYSLFKETHSQFFSTNQPMENVCNQAQCYSLQSLEPHTHTHEKQKTAQSFYLHDQIPFQLTRAFQLKLIFALENQFQGYTLESDIYFLNPLHRLQWSGIFRKLKPGTVAKKSAWPVKLALLASFCDCSAFLCWLAQDFQQESLSQRFSGYKAGQSGRGSAARVHGPESRRE